MEKEKFLFRNVFNASVVEELSQSIKKSFREFDGKSFTEEINSQIEKLNFGERSALIASKLAEYLPKNFPRASKILIKALGPEPTEDSLSGFSGFIIMPQCDFIAKYGIDYPDESLSALYEMTKRFTAEGQIRVFIRKYPEKTMRFLEKLTRDPSPFARRLASEGTRPRLPLGSRLQEFVKDPAPVILILDKLKNDPSLMVRRSVSNNINDIAKDNPEIAVETLKRWEEARTPEIKWLVRHAARTLLKQGNPGALELLGFTKNPQVSVSELDLQKRKLSAGDDLSFSFLLKSTSKKVQRLMIDYSIHFMKANGKQKPKVFKLTSKNVKAGEELIISKKLPLKKRTTRALYSGEHLIEIIINGRTYGKINFYLKV